MFKKIFLFFFLILLIIWGYFYIFPIYPDYDIPENYFETRFHNEWFDSPKNGFKDYKKLMKSLDDHGEILGEFDLYYKCYLENTCLNELKDLSEIERKSYLQDIIWDKEKIQKFWEISKNFLDKFEKLLDDYEFISLHNYNESAEYYPTWGEIIHYTKFMSLSRGIIFFSHYTSEKEALKMIWGFYSSLSLLSFKLDSWILSYLVVNVIISMHLDYIEDNLSRFSPITKRLFKNILNAYNISPDMVKNGVISEYLYWIITLENVFVKTLEKNLNIKTLLFYDHEETVNIARKIEYDHIQWKCGFEIKKNGKNFIGRTLMEGRPCMNSNIQKQNDLLKKREELIQLLSS